MMFDSDLDQLIAAWLDGRISESDSQSLQERLRESAEARARFLDLTDMDSALRQIAGADNSADIATAVAEKAKTSPNNGSSLTSILFKFAIAASLLLAVGLLAYQFGKSSGDDVASVPDSRDEKTISGHASLRRVAAIQWPDDGEAYREGDVLPAGVMEIAAGVAEIDFFCGATVIVEGPAKMELESDWSVRLLRGRLRANVPPSAQGFVVKVADSEVIDLGTEFALNVTPENAFVHVVDGEVRLKGGEHDGEHLKTGQGQTLVGSDVDPESFKTLSTVGDLQRKHDQEARDRFGNWKLRLEELKKDDRLVALYPIGLHDAGRYVANAAISGCDCDGKLVGPVATGHGRFGVDSRSFDFSRPGSRVRVRVDGEFEQFTFVCWARVDSLEHRYNALFMGDGYENGEPHWQICEDGRLMLSVMVDDTPGSGRGNAPDARLHRIYHSEPMWDISRSGQWMHIASVYDPGKRIVRHFVNGSEISSESITDEFYVDKLRVGSAEIGNWGQPLRKSPWFAVRNLNGAIDELAIFNAALSDEEIRKLYEDGKPFGN